MYIGILTNSMVGEDSGEDIIERIKYAHKLGFDAIELSCTPARPGKRGLWERRYSLEKGFLKELQEVSSLFKIVNFHAYFNTFFDKVYIAPHPLCKDIYMDEIKWAIDLANTLNGSVITFHTNWLCHGKTPLERKMLLSNALIELDRIVKENNILLGAEVVDYFMPVNHFELLEELQLNNIGITLDTGHISMTPRKGPIHYYDRPAYYPYGSISGFIERFGKKIFNLHVHDYDGKKDHIPLGEGIIDFKAIVKSLKKIKYSGALTFEIDMAHKTLIEENKARLEKLLT